VEPEDRAFKSPDGKPSRILVVDDDDAVRKVVTAILRRAGDFRLIEARDGVEAQEVLQREAVDLAVVDLVMPRMDGLSLIEWGRRSGLDVSWIILSGRGSFDAAVKAIQLGAFDFITKPPQSSEALIVTVRNALRQRHLAAERERLTRDVEQRNVQLRKQVDQLEQACRLLHRQQKTIDEDLHRAELIQRALLPYGPPLLAGFGVPGTASARRCWPCCSSTASA
jgi:DNA-binding NtrC family response regulator